MTMRTLVRFEYDIENVKLFDIVDGGAVHGAFNGNLSRRVRKQPSDGKRHHLHPSRKVGNEQEWEVWTPIRSKLLRYGAAKR